MNPDLDKLLRDAKPATAEELKAQGESLARNYVPGPRQARMIREENPMGENTKGSILTASGRFVDPLRPDPEQLVLEDMAHALGHLCRFTGHCRRFYSVAEHLVRGVAYIPQEHKLAWLLHDAAEAYLGDVASPVKRSDVMRDYCAAEEWLFFQLRGKFGLADMRPLCVKQVDLRMLATEMRDLMPARPDWEVRSIAEPFDGVIPSRGSYENLQWGGEWLAEVRKVIDGTPLL